jgi:UMF1 family MFS transporter
MVVTYAMPKVLFDETGRESPLAWASASAMVLSALAGPFLGALADATRSTKRQVVLWSALCCACTVGLWLVPAGRVGWLLALFTLAFFAYNVAISLYDAFLPEICTAPRMGLVSGIGVGVGYLGALLGYPVAMAMQERRGFDAIFLAAGVLMFLFALPMFLLVRERETAERRRFTPRLGAAEFAQAARTIRSLAGRASLLLFLLANLLAVDSLNAMIQWVAQFFRNAWRAGEEEVLALLVGLSISAFVMGIAAGRVADRVGAERVLLAAVASLLSVAVVDAFVPHRGIAIGVTVLGGGLGAAGVWLSGRRILVDRVPRERLGEYMGILGVTRKASVFGTVLLASLADAVSWRAAIASLAVPLLAAGVLLVLSGRALARERAVAAGAAA